MLTQVELDKIIQICKEAGIDYLALFGSYARGDFTQSSDIDLLVNYKNTPTLFEEARTKIKLEDNIGKKIDLVTERCLKPNRRPYVEQDLKTLYDQR